MILLRFKQLACHTIICATILAAPISHADNAPAADANPDAEPRIQALESITPARDAMSARVTQFANWLDSFFGDERLYDESQNSHIKLNLLQISEDEREPRYDAQLKGKLTLPNTQRKLKLLIESDAEETADEAEAATLTEAVESQEQSIGLRYIQRDTPQWRIQTDAGVRFRSGFDSFVRLRIRRQFFADLWTFRFAETVFWYDSRGIGETTRLDSDRHIATHYLFRSTTFATWLKDNEYFDLGQDFYLFHDISKRRAVVYQAGVAGISEPDVHATRYLLSIRLRQQLHRDWLYFEINPRVTYPEEEDYDAVKAIIFKLEVVFGAA
jgi:hypothetical protein